jgi:hypothetical protein
MFGDVDALVVYVIVVLGYHRDGHGTVTCG